MKPLRVRLRLAIRLGGLCGVAVGLVLAGCAAKAPPPATTEVTRAPEQGDWFCQMNESGNGWQCVQDPKLARDPEPTRLPQPAGGKEEERASVPTTGSGTPATQPPDGAPFDRSPQAPSAEPEGSTAEATPAPRFGGPAASPGAPPTTQPSLPADSSSGVRGSMAR